MWRLMRPLKLSSGVMNPNHLLMSSLSPHIIEMELRQGRPQLTLPLPSRHESCVFTLLPLSHSVSDLLQMLHIEDKGVDRAFVKTMEGTRIASATNLADLMAEGDFNIEINDKTYVVRPPQEYVAKGKEKEMQEDLDKIRVLVSRLYSSLRVRDSQLLSARRLEAQRELIRAQLAPMEQQKQLLEAKAERRASILTWTGLGLMSVQFGVLARLTWWEYSWDIMEPVTYFVTYGTGMACYAYFVLTRHDYIFPQVRHRQFLLGFYKQAKKQPWDVAKYNGLQANLASIELELERLKQIDDEKDDDKALIEKDDNELGERSERNGNDMSQLESLSKAWQRPSSDNR